MAAPSSPLLRHLLRVTAYIGMTLVVYWANDHTPPDIRLGILYVVPGVLVTWTDGLALGLGFAALTILLREVVAWEQLPQGTPTLWRVVNAASYVVVTDARGVRYSHPNPALIGKPVDENPASVLAGQTWVGVQRGTLGISARGKAPIFYQGQVIGMVSVGENATALVMLT